MFSSNTSQISAVTSTNSNWDGVQIYYDHNHGDAVRASVAWSDDNSNWTNIGTTDNIASGNIGYISATWTAPGRKRYWRLTFTDPNDGNIGGQSDEIREVDWRLSGSYITSSATKASHNATITTNTIGGTLANVYDGNTGTGTTSIQEGSYLIFDFGVDTSGGAGGGGGGGGGGNTLQYKYGSCPGGTSMSGITYSGLGNGPTTLTLGTTASFTGTSGDRCVVVDLGGTVNNSSTTATQNGSNYFSVWTSTDGSNWTQRVSYSSVGSGSSYTYSLSSASHRYVAYTSGEGGFIFNSIKVNSYS